MNEFKHYHNIIEKSRFVNSDKREVQFRNSINRFFEEWKRQIVSNLKKELGNREVQKALGDYNLSSIIYLASSKIKSFISKLSAISTGAAKQGIERSYKDMGVTIAWDINMDKIGSFYKRKYQDWVSKVVEKEIQANLKDEIREGIESGESIDNIAKRIEEFFEHPITVPEKKDDEGNITRKAYQIDQKVYSEMLARTEVSGAVNNGRLDGYSESNLVKSVRWFANPGACEYCEMEKGQVFDVGEAQNLIPLHPNCRCTWIAEEYGEFKEEPISIFSSPEKVASDPHGAKITEYLKLNDDQKSQVEELFSKDKYREAIDLMDKFMRELE